MSSTWADWTVLPAINVVNVVLFTGDLSAGARHFDALTAYHLYLDMLDSDTGLVIDTACIGKPNKCLSALIDTSGGSDDGFVQSRCNAVANAWVYYGLRQVARAGL